MCFSATASFTLSGVLAATGAASIGRSASPARRMFAATPLLFAAQQAAEGVIWLTIGDARYATLEHAMVLVFLGVALIVWPIWLPVSLRRAERDPAHRRILTILCCMGVIVAAFALAALMRERAVAVIVGHSIRYDHSSSLHVPHDWITVVAYACPTILPLFASSIRLTRMIGVALVGSLLLTFVVERQAVTSVWCFFAAILSAFVWLAAGERQSNGPL